MNIKKLLIQIIIYSSVVAVVNSAFSAPLVIRFSHVVSPDAPKGKMAGKFRDLVRQRIGDERVVVTIYPNSELFGDSKVLDAMLKGDVEIAAPSLSKLKKYSKRFQVVDLPFVFANPVAAEKFLQSKYGDRLLNTLKSKGFHGLGYLNNGMRQLSSNKRMLLPDDINGLKFRYSGSNIAQAWLESVEVVAMDEPFSKVYELLETKQIDGQMNVWSNIYSKKFHEHQAFIVESNHSYLGYAIITSNEFWKELPDDLKVLLEKAMHDAIEYGNEIAAEKVLSDRQAIVDSGLSEVYKLTTDQRQAWTEAVLPIWEQFEDEIGSELIQAAASQR